MRDRHFTMKREKPGPNQAYSFLSALSSCSTCSSDPKGGIIVFVFFLLGVAAQSFTPLLPLNPLQSNLQTLRTGIPQASPYLSRGILPSISLQVHSLSSQGKLCGVKRSKLGTGVPQIFTLCPLALSRLPGHVCLPLHIQ